MPILMQAPTSETTPMTIAKFTEKLVPISDFSQGKAGKIFSDVAKNDNEYIVLKNNKPTAVLISMKEYNVMQSKIVRFEQLFEEIENLKLLKLAQSRKGDKYTSFEELVAKDGFNLNEIKKISESIKFE